MSTQENVAFEQFVERLKAEGVSAVYRQGQLSGEGESIVVLRKGSQLIEKHGSKNTENISDELSTLLNLSEHFFKDATVDARAIVPDEMPADINGDRVNAPSYLNTSFDVDEQELGIIVTSFASSARDIEAMSNSSKTIDRLKDQGFTELRLEYAGSGDSGDHFEITYFNAENEETPAYAIDDSEVIDSLLSCVLENYHPGWEINEGSQGTVSLDLNTGVIDIEHTSFDIDSTVESYEIKDVVNVVNDNASTLEKIKANLAEGESLAFSYSQEEYDGFYYYDFHVAPEYGASDVPLEIELLLSDLAQTYNIATVNYGYEGSADGVNSHELSYINKEGMGAKGGKDLAAVVGEAKANELKEQLLNVLKVKCGDWESDDGGLGFMAINTQGEQEINLSHTARFTGVDSVNIASDVAKNAQEVLLNKGITQIEFEYEGSGGYTDSFNVSDAFYGDKQITGLELDSELHNSLDSLTLEAVNNTHPDWNEGDGGYGLLRVDVQDMSAELTHTSRKGRTFNELFTVKDLSKPRQITPELMGISEEQLESLAYSLVQSCVTEHSEEGDRGTVSIDVKAGTALLENTGFYKTEHYSESKAVALTDSFKVGGQQTWKPSTPTF